MGNRSSLPVFLAGSVACACNPLRCQRLQRIEPLLPHLEFVDLHHRGFVLLDITHERLQAEWWVVNRVETPRYQSACLRAYQIPAGESRLIPAQPVLPETLPQLAGFKADLAYLREWSPAGAETAGGGGMLAAHNTAP